MPVTDKWPEIKLLAEQGVPFRTLSEKYEVLRGTIEKRAEREKWLTPQFLQSKLSEMSENVGRAAGQPPASLAKSEPDKDNVLATIAETWEQRASSVRNLAWQIGQSSLRGLDKTGVPIRDAGDVAKTIKFMREATGLFSEQAAVQVSVFSGQSVGFDGKTVETDTEIIEVATEYEEEM
jgi:hypothetical protein